MASTDLTINGDRFVLPTAEHTKDVRHYEKISSYCAKFAALSFGASAVSLGISSAAPVFLVVAGGAFAVGVAALLVALWANTMLIIKSECAKAEILKAVEAGKNPSPQALAIVLSCPWNTNELAQELKTKNITQELKDLLIASEKAVRPKNASILAEQL